MASPTFVLVGGEAYEWQGVEPERREFQHTSVAFVGSAYESLRSSGIPRSSIITIVQLQDYLNVLATGTAGKLTDSTGIPPRWYEEQKQATEEKCGRLIAEGGANYDFNDVNPATVWSVLLGEHVSGAADRPVAQADGLGAIVFGIYSHGDCHPAGVGTEADEWFAHFPYASTRSDICEFVATSGAKDAGVGKNRPQYYLYSTQLRLIFHRIFERCPGRPILGLLNYCLSGGNLEFMRRESVRRHLGVDKWPLFLMSSSQSKKESMVAGMWDAWFRQVQACLQSGGSSMANLSIKGLYDEAVAAYYRDNLYELLNAIKARVYAPRVWREKFSFPGQKDDDWDPWHIDLSQALQRCLPPPGGSFSYEPMVDLHRAYEAGECFCLIRRATPEQHATLLKTGGVAVVEGSGDLVVWTNGSHKAWRHSESSQLAEMRAEPFCVKLVEYAGTQETGPCRHLADILRKALADVAHPEEVHGADADIADRALRDVLNLSIR